MRRILVTGVGGGVGQGIIKCFQGTPYEVIGTNVDPLGAGLFAVAGGYTVPPASSPDYIPRLREIARAEKCVLLLAGLDIELPALAAGAAALRDAGLIPVVSSPEVVEIADNKLATSRFLRANGFDAPRTVPLSSPEVADLPLPLVLKPMKGGARSVGVYLVADRRELAYRLETLDRANYIAQEFVEGDEYTAGTLTFDGKCQGTIVMRRILRDGDTYKAFVVADPALHRFVAAAAEALKPFGPCNFQFRVRGGKPYVFEINARCSGTTYFRALAGVNEPLLIADHLLDGKPIRYAPREIAVLRYWNEIVVENDRLEALKARGVVEGNGSRL